MDNLIVSLNVVLPLFFTMSLGYLLKRIRLFDESGMQSVNTLCFKVFLPILLFHNIYRTQLKEVFNFKLIIFALGSIGLIFLILLMIIPRLEKEDNRRGVMIQGIFRSNFIIFGLPVIISLFGEEFAGVPSLLGAVVVPLFNALAVIVLEIYRGSKISVWKIVKGIAKNPLILASLLGIMMLLLGVKLPFALEKTIGDLAKLATPLSLLTLGGTFVFSSVHKHFKQLLFTVSGKLVLVPLLFVPISIGLGFRGIELASLIVLFSAPTAVSSYTMAEQMGADSELAGHIVIFGSALSILTVFLWILITKQLGYI